MPYKSRTDAKRAEYKYAAENPEKREAVQVVRQALRRGELVKEPCLFCDDVKVEAHHHDYALPLVVTWLCRRHHKLAHRKLVLATHCGHGHPLSGDNLYLYGRARHCRACARRRVREHYARKVAQSGAK